MPAYLNSLPPLSISLGSHEISPPHTRSLPNLLYSAQLFPSDWFPYSSASSHVWMTPPPTPPLLPTLVALRWPSRTHSAAQKWRPRRAATRTAKRRIGKRVVALPHHIAGLYAKWKACSSTDSTLQVRNTE